MTPNGRGMGPRPASIAASILTADFGNLYRVVRKLERAGVDRIHLDVMDGHFVPNITFGPDVVRAIRGLTRLPLDAHLMISEPSRYVERFLDAGSDSVTFHVEVDETDDMKRSTLDTIRSAGRAAGLAVSPRTPTSAVEPFFDLLDIVMVMTVEPGWGGQRFIVECAPKIGEARRMFDARGRDGQVHVDGGVNRETAAIAGAEGVDVLVVGSALFQRRLDTAVEVEAVRRRAEAARATDPSVTGRQPAVADARS
jgi:ribulose-phosphate 3-epimerase